MLIECARALCVSPAVEILYQNCRFIRKNYITRVLPPPFPSLALLRNTRLEHLARTFLHKSGKQLSTLFILFRRIYIIRVHAREY